MDKLSNPLQLLLNQASKLPAAGEVERFEQRFEGATTDVVILCDVSSSMDESAGARRKIELLQDALDSIYPQLPDARIVAFNSTVRETSGGALPKPEGGTAMHFGIEYAGQYKPRQSVVISDGQPDNEDLALTAAADLSGTIDVIYCGPDSDKEAIAFMQRLARSGGGRVVYTGWSRTNGYALAPTMRRVLALPEPRD